MNRRWLEQREYLDQQGLWLRSRGSTTTEVEMRGGHGQFHRHFRAQVRNVAHKNQRYDTCGDWNWLRSEQSEQAVVTVSHLSDWRREYAVALHELIEAALCRHAGVTEAEVTAWDLAHLAGAGNPLGLEPGEIDGAPYFKQHAFATLIEKMIIAEFGIDWDEYSKEIQEL